MMPAGFKDPNEIPLLDITVLQQTKMWVDGKSVHRRIRIRTVKQDTGEPVAEHFSYECCPDFSCCDPSLLMAPKSKRVDYWKKEITRRIERVTKSHG